VGIWSRMPDPLQAPRIGLFVQNRGSLKGLVYSFFKTDAS
jgi:hypothetical protein